MDVVASFIVNVLFMFPHLIMLFDRNSLSLISSSLYL